MRKVLKLTALAMALVFVMGMGLGVLTASAATTGYIVTQDPNGSVNVRKTASQNGTILTKLKNGTKVSVQSKSGDFSKITAGSTTGYVLSTYITSKAPSSTTSTSSKRTGQTTKATKIYKSAKSSSTNVLMSIASGKTFTIVSSTDSFFKVTYDGKTGYILKSAAKETTKTSTSTSTPKPTKTQRPGDSINVYTTTDITKPPETVSTKVALYNAINYNLVNLVSTFTIKCKNFENSWLPSSMSSLERSFTTGPIKIDSLTTDKDKVTSIKFIVTYSEAGKLLQAYKSGKAPTDSKVKTMKTEVDKVISATKGKSDYDKVVYIHDWLVKYAQYDKDMTKPSYTAYGVLTGKLASCQGYAETMALVLTACGVENRFVWANSLMTSDGSHGFNKVKVDGKWYNVDATVDDPVNGAADAVKHDFCLVTDAVSKQRYKWDEKRYPASNTDNNWHKRNGLVASSQSELEKLVKEGVAKKQKYISVWVTDYSSTKYKTSFAKSLSGVKSVKATTTPATSGYKTYQTAIFFTFTY